MCIFKRKSMYRYKMFERFRINIDKVIELQNENEAEYCKLIGSTDRFNLYLYKVNKNDSNGYLLRQDKINVKKVVYFGMAKNSIIL